MIQPLADNVLIRPLPYPKRSIEVYSKHMAWVNPLGCDPALRPFELGEVLAVGPGVRGRKHGALHVPDVKVGERVIFCGGIDFGTQKPHLTQCGEDVLVGEYDVVAVVE